MTSMTQDFKNLKKKNLVIFVLLVNFEILSDYPNIDSCHWLKEDFQWIAYKNFIQRVFGLKGFDTFLSHFSIRFWFLPVFVVVLIVKRLIVMS